MIYKLFMPSQAVGASLVYFDLWKIAAGGKKMTLLSVVPIVSGAVAVTGVVAVDLFLTRTTAVGTTGTAATIEGTSLTAATFSAYSGDGAIDLSGVSARLTPGGGATAGAVLSSRSVFSEETSAGTYIQIADMVRNSDSLLPPMRVPDGSGIRVVQGSVASVGNIGFDIFFDLS